MLGRGRELAESCRRDALRCALAGVRLHRAAGQRREHDANRFARRIGPAERARRAAVAEGLPGASGTARLLSHAKAEPARCESILIVVRDHQPRRFWPHHLAAGMQEFVKKQAQVRRGSVRSSPRSAELSPPPLPRPPALPPWPARELRLRRPTALRAATRTIGKHLWRPMPSPETCVASFHGLPGIGQRKGQAHGQHLAAAICGVRILRQSPGA